MLFQDVNGKLIDKALYPGDNADSFKLQMQNFVDSTRGTAPPINNAQQAVHLMKILDAVYLSISSRREVPIARV